MKWYNEILNKVKTIFMMSAEATEAEVHEQLSKINTIEAAAADVEKIRQEVGHEFSTQVGELEKQVERLTQTIDQRDKKIEELSNQVKAQAAEIETLKKEPAAEHTAGVTESSAPTKNDKPWMSLPINQRRIVSTN
jgi:chromosome segregation ATPase